MLVCFWKYQLAKKWHLGKSLHSKITNIIDLFLNRYTKQKPIHKLIIACLCIHHRKFRKNKIANNGSVIVKVIQLHHWRGFDQSLEAQYTIKISLLFIIFRLFIKFLNFFKLICWTYVQSNEAYLLQNIPLLHWCTDANKHISTLHSSIISCTEWWSDTQYHKLLQYECHQVTRAVPISG